MSVTELLFEAADCYPNCSCESAVWSIFNLPLSFWSSLAYFVATILLYRTMQTKNFKNELWTFICLNLCLSSLLFHAFHLRSTLAMDYASIIMALSYFTLMPYLKNYFRSYLKSEMAILTLYLLVWIIFLFLNKPARIGLSCLIFLCCLPELKQQLKIKPYKNRIYLYCSLSFLMMGFGFFLLEESRIWCQPEHWLQGHVVWHLASASALYCYGRFRFS